MEPMMHQLISSSRLLVIVFEAKHILRGLLERIFVRGFHNKTTKVHAQFQEEDARRYQWLQGHMNQLPQGRQLKFIIETMRQIFEFLRLQYPSYVLFETFKLEEEVMLQLGIKTLEGSQNLFRNLQKFLENLLQYQKFFKNFSWLQKFLKDFLWWQNFF